MKNRIYQPTSAASSSELLSVAASWSSLTAQTRIHFILLQSASPVGKNAPVLLTKRLHYGLLLECILTCAIRVQISNILSPHLRTKSRKMVPTCICSSNETADIVHWNKIHKLQIKNLTIYPFTEAFQKRTCCEFLWPNYTDSTRTVYKGKEIITNFATQKKYPV